MTGFDAPLVRAVGDKTAKPLASKLGLYTADEEIASMLRRMLDARADSPYPASLRCVLLGGGPAPAPRTSVMIGFQIACDRSAVVKRSRMT